MMTAAEIRQQFLDFFASKGHAIVPSAPIVVKDDPTLMFTNAGMNQFKDYFLGNKHAENQRVADTQKCLRVSGKHNDLEEVGVDTYHHTMFEMLGNWSFGDPARTGGYFKKEAIEWSWELLTKVYGIPYDRLYVTIFEGDEAENLPKDDEAAAEWAKNLLAAGFTDADLETRILHGNKKDNFWEMGDTGPCGPCTEIHVDCRSDQERAELPGHQLVNNDHPQVIEIWNNVFIQFNRLKNSNLESLPARHVDTGMGLERLVRILQQKTSNYDTDLFSGTLAAIEKITGRRYNPEAQPADADAWKEAVAFRVLADHIRAISFTIADGQLPSNTGAGYVIRRILRRAVRYYYSYLHYHQPLLSQLVPVLARQFENVFPGLQQQVDFVQRVVHEEETAFLSTLDRGLRRIQELVQESDQQIAGEKAFELYDTYGFPLDLTRLIAAENNLEVDEAGFEASMQQQKDRSRTATAIDAGDWTVITPEAGSQFVGYDDLKITTHVVKYRKIKAKGKEQFQVVLAATPFYAESGGQTGDQGTLKFQSETINVTDTKKENDLIIHFVNKLPANIEGDVEAAVDFERRLNTMYNHTGTHLLHAALREVLGTHVTQKGSLVAPDLLRFDVSHFSKITDDELKQVMRIVNRKIREDHKVEIKEMPREQAMQSGAMALFGEKYGDTVRVVTADPNFSIELCGGTHVQQTGMIGLLVVTSEAAIAAGVRRIEALTGPAAFHYLQEKVEQNRQLADMLKSNDPIKAISKLMADKAALEKRVEALEARQLVAVRNELLTKDEIINQINFIGDIVEVPAPDALKKLCFDLRNHLSDYVVVLAANIGGKPHVAVSIADNVVAARNLDAQAIIKQVIAPLIKGGGGGQKNLATAGGNDVSNLPQVIDAVRGLL